MEEGIKKRGRGKGKKVALAFTSIRLEPHVMKWYREAYPTRTQAKMREILKEYAEQSIKELSNEQNREDSQGTTEVSES
jgi:uncharacterized protein (DUF4415 family)